MRELLVKLAGYLPSDAARLLLYRTVGGVEIGTDSTVRRGCTFLQASNVSIGANTIIAHDAFLDARRGITIGDCVVTGSEVAIYTLQHDMDDPFFRTVGGPVVIDDYSYLGTRSIILPGVRVGRGGVVMAGAVVAHDVPPFAVVGGVPARFVRERAHDLRYRPKYGGPSQ